MFERISDRWKKDASGALWLVMIAAASLVAATVTVSFLCAAAFVVAFERYGLVDACLAGAGVFLVATMALLGTYAIYVARRRRDAQVRAALEPPPMSALADPRVILAGLQIVQAIGFKRLLPILAIGGAAFALASRPASEGRRRGARARRREPPPLLRQVSRDRRVRAARLFTSSSFILGPCEYIPTPSHPESARFHWMSPIDGARSLRPRIWKRRRHSDP